jgi:hypothetical protein
MPKERDFLVRAIDCQRLDCKHLYLEIIFGILRSMIRSIARQMPSIDGTMSFRLENLDQLGQPQMSGR